MIEDFPFAEVEENSENSTHLIQNVLKNIDKAGRKLKTKTDIDYKLKSINGILEIYQEIGLITDKDEMSARVSFLNSSVHLGVDYTNLHSIKIKSIFIKSAYPKSWLNYDATINWGNNIHQFKVGIKQIAQITKGIRFDYIAKTMKKFNEQLNKMRVR